VSIPFFSFSYMNSQVKPAMMAKFESFFDHSWYILGDQLETFEKEYAEFNKVEFAVGVSNGLDALHIALKSLGVGMGDEVIVPSNTYIATLLAVSYVGAKPILVEPCLDTYNIDPARIAESITARTKAIIPVHLYGQCCEMESIMNLSATHGLFVVEDNAQAHGACFKGKPTGSFGQINGVSFYPGKNLGALGDAGAVTTNNGSLAEKARMLRNYGSQKKYFNEIIGFNMRLDECQAGFLSVKLKYIQQWNEDRKSIASNYNQLLEGVGDLVLPKTAKDASHVYHQYVIRSKYRDQLQDHLTKREIGTLIHYPVPPHLQEAYKSLKHQKGDFPIAEQIADTCLSLPVWPGLSKDQQEEITTQIRQFFNAV
jgi:dTDP-4-amino-4,6-dideoxygalactose transaminase